MRKSSAPSFVAETACSMVPNAVRRMQMSLGYLALAAFSSWRPSAPGIRTSESMRTMEGSASRAFMACSASGAVVTW